MNLEDKVNYFTKSAVFLFPSHNENFPLVIIEAACAGLPIISTRVGAVPEFFEHMKNIFFVEPGNLLEIKDNTKLFNEKDSILGTRNRKTSLISQDIECQKIKIITRPLINIKKGYKYKNNDNYWIERNL